jgi:hypothetical protein
VNVNAIREYGSRVRNSPMKALTPRSSSCSSIRYRPPDAHVGVDDGGEPRRIRSGSVQAA